jgi:cysteinyl-tRNA synthetase
LLLHNFALFQFSAPLSAVLPENIDIHSGGSDLAFPHHDNEIAQSEAYYNCKQWVNYFLHAGHLHVEGQKMSKSLKNFISIQEALQKYTARQLRLFYLLHQWDTRMDFKDSGMQDTMDKEKFMNVRMVQKYDERKPNMPELN